MKFRASTLAVSLGIGLAAYAAGPSVALAGP